MENNRNKYYINYIQGNFRNTKKVYQIINKILGRVTLSIDAAMIKAFESKSHNTKDLIAVENFASGFDKAVKNISRNCNVTLPKSNMYSKPVNLSIFSRNATINYY